MAQDWQDRLWAAEERAARAKARIAELERERDARDRQHQNAMASVLADLASAERAIARRTEERNKFASELSAPRSSPPPDEALRAEVERLRAVVHAYLCCPDSHYAHFDPTGGAGSGCPACQARLKVNLQAHAALSTQAPAPSAPKINPQRHAGAVDT